MLYSFYNVKYKCFILKSIVPYLHNELPVSKPFSNYYILGYVANMGSILGCVELNILRITCRFAVADRELRKPTVV